MIGPNFVVIKSINTKTNKIVDEKIIKNVVLLRGRNWMVQRLSNINLGMLNWDEGTPHGYPRRDAKSMYISWMGFGSGGTEYNVETGAGDPFKNVIVHSYENDLNVWAHNIYPVEYSDTTINNNILYYKKIVGGNVVWRQFHRISIEIVNDIAIPNIEKIRNDILGTYSFLDPSELYKEYPTDSYIVLKITCILEDYEYNSNYNTPQLNGQLINEAALFVSDSHNSIPSEEPLIFAKITFPSFLKNENVKELIYWYLFF